MQYTAWSRVAEKWEMMVNRRSDRHLLSLSDGSRRVVAEEAANWFRRAADEVAILKRLFFGRRPLCHVLCSPCRCSRQTPGRINGSVCDVHATLGGAFGFAMVWDREGRQHRVIFCVHGLCGCSLTVLHVLLQVREYRQMLHEFLI